MARTHAERQRAYRERQARRMAGLEAECARLRGELAGVDRRLDIALAEAERLAGQACLHQAPVIDGRCQACGSYDV